MSPIRLECQTAIAVSSLSALQRRYWTSEGESRTSLIGPVLLTILLCVAYTPKGIGDAISRRMLLSSSHDAIRKQIYNQKLIRPYVLGYSGGRQLQNNPPNGLSYPRPFTFDLIITPSSKHERSKYGTYIDGL